MLANIAPIVMIALVGVILICCTVLLHEFNQAATVSGILTSKGENDDKQALESILWLIAEAQESLEIFDDGNEMDGSIYQEASLTNAIREKLAKTPSFRVVCYFNEEEELLFHEAFKDEDRVRIFPGLEPHPKNRPSEVHYKIVDGGRIGYVSQHGYSGSIREYQQWDCRHFSGRKLKAKADFLYKKMREHARAKHERKVARAA